VTPFAIGHLDEPGSGQRRPGVVKVRGWVVGIGTPVLRVRAVAGGVSTNLARHFPRPDVAAAHPEASAGLAGFEGWVQVDGGGPCCVTVVADLANGTTYDVGDVVLHVGLPRDAFPPRVLIWGRSLDLGGSQLRVAELAEVLVERGAQVRVTAEDDGPLRGRLEAAGVQVSLRTRVPTSDLDAYEAGVAAVVDEGRDQHDVVLGVGGTAFAAVEAADRWGIPAVLRVGEAEPLPVVADWLGMPWSAPMEHRARRAFALAHTVVANSAAAVRTYRSQGWVANYVVVNDGTDLTAIDGRGGLVDRERTRSRWGISAGDLLVLTPGTLWPIKGQALLVDALAQIAHEHPRVRLAFIGQQDPDYAQGVRDRAAHHGLDARVRVATFKGGMDEWYRACDVVAIPSVSESMPAVALEAMAYQVPVLAARVGDLATLVVEGETGWLSEPSDVGDLSAALRRAAATGRQDHERMGRTARDRLSGVHDAAVSRARWCDLLIAAAADRAAGRR
jgi:D-inositol-3-phosphate glycosyltransferase